jgi:uncharacterized lipoprotein YmbA
MKPLFAARLFVAVAALALLTACSSTPDNHYYTLSAEPGPTRAAAATLTMGAVHLPGITDRPQLVTRTGPQTVDIKEFDRWAEALDQMVPRILAEDLTLRLGLPEAGKPIRRLFVTIDEFMGGADGSAHLSGRWWLLAPGEDAAQKHEQPFAFSHGIAGDQPQAVAASMSTLLATLADQIAAADTLNTN